MSILRIFKIIILLLLSASASATGIDIDSLDVTTKSFYSETYFTLDLNDTDKAVVANYSDLQTYNITYMYLQFPTDRLDVYFGGVLDLKTVRPVIGVIMDYDFIYNEFYYVPHYINFGSAISKKFNLHDKVKLKFGFYGELYKDGYTWYSFKTKLMYMINNNNGVYVVSDYDGEPSIGLGITMGVSL